MPTPPRRSSLARAYRLLIALAFVAFIVFQLLSPIPPTVADAASTSVVISQVYGGAGCTTAGCSTYKNDFIELYNRGASPVILNGWSVQYASATGSSWQVTPLTNVTLQPGQYYLIQEAGNANGTNSLPTPDATGSISMSATSAKVALVNSSAPLTGTCPTTNIVDLVGYGSSATTSGFCFEGAGPVPALSTSTAAIRKGNGATDTDSNLNDFTVAAPSPRTCTTVGGQPCTAPTNLAATTAANPSTVAAGDSPLLTVSVTPGANPTSTGISVKVNLSSIGGPTTQQFFDDGTNGDTTAGDNTFSFKPTIPNGTSGGTKNLAVTITDGQGRSLNTASITLTVQAPTAISGTGAATPSSLQVGQSSLLTVTVTPGTNPTSSGITVTADLSPIGGSAAQSFFDDGTNGDQTAGDKVFSFNATVAAGTSLGTKTLPIAIADAYPRNASASITLAVKAAPAQQGIVVISQVYGGGGNSGATLKNDFIELFNRSSSPVDLTGWSVQYASAGGGTGATWTRKTDLSGTINPGQYFLVQEAAGTGGSVDLPTPNVVGSIAMGATDGKVALVSDTDFLPNGCPVGNPYVVDFVGYGSADCYEGTAAAPTLSNTTAALRTRNGCKDTDYNSINFVVGPPAPRNSTSTFNFCPANDLAPEVYSTNPANGGTNFSLDGNITVNFDSSVNVADGAFVVSCSKSGAHSVVVSGGPTTFTLNPDVDFQSGEQCTVKVVASQVSSQTSPPLFMASDYIWSFGTFIVRDPAENMVMGNPSGAVTDENQPLNYLMMKPQYALSYNNDKGTTNWTSWHLDSTWTTNVSDRQNDFRSDDTLPASFKHVTSGYNFATYGFDRGHMCPSADRTSSVADNSATFLMTNMVPQASGNNQGPWAALESYIRAQLNGTQNELYIISGPAGTGGNSSTGHWDTILDTGGNSVTVPQYTWKVVMVLPNADGDDVARVDTSTRTFAVIMPNNDNIRNDDWRKYLATVDQVEALTGYDFFSNVPVNIQKVIEARLDDVNDTAPVADSQTTTTAEDTQEQITLTASDFNVNNVLTYTVVSGPAHGSLSGTGSNLIYMPDQDYNGSDSFTFKANDGDKDSNTATVSITITEVNDAPIANADSKTTDEDTSLSFPANDLTANDTAGAANESAQTLTVKSVIAGGSTHGTVSLVGGQVTYMPAANYNGPASFDYQVCDDGTTAGAADAKCSTGTVNVMVNSVNDNPVATNDSAVTDEDVPVTIDVVANDTDVDNDPLTLDSIGNAVNGTVIISGGKALFSPDTNFNGIGSFTYIVKDGQGGQATGSVTVTVNPVNDAPTANAQAVTTDEDTYVNVTLTGSDVETQASDLNFAVTVAPQHGRLTGTVPHLTYVPNANYNGADSFQFTVTDTGDGASHALTSAAATVSITINPVNDAPVLAGVPVNVTINEQELYTFTATATDVDVPAQTLTFSLVGAPAGASIDPSTGQFTWTPTEAQGGTGTPYQFKVRVTDGVAITETNMTINVAEVNQAPTLSPIGNKTVYLGNTLSFTAVGTDQDIPVQTLSYSLAGTIPAGATINGSTGQFTWTPTLQQVGAIYTFKVRVTDGTLLAEEQISVGVAYTWSNFLQPVNTNGGSTFKLGSTIPVKFTLTGASAGINSAVAHLMLAKISDGVIGTEVEASSTSAATTGNLFRYDPTNDQYIFNLSTRGLTQGTYQLSVDMGDGVLRAVNISLIN